MIKILLFILSLTFFTFADQKLKNDHYVIKSDKLILNSEILEVDKNINDEEIEVDEVGGNYIFPRKGALRNEFQMTNEPLYKY